MRKLLNSPASQEDFVSFWDIVGRQFRKNKVAVVSLVGVKAIILIAVAAPLIAFNVPYILKGPDGIEWPLFDRLFNRFLFASGVDVFFNLALVLAPVWWLGLRLARAAGISGSARVPLVAAVCGLLLLALLVFYGVVAGGDQSIFLQLLIVAVVGLGVIVFQAWRLRDLMARQRLRVRAQTRIFLAVLFLGTFGLTMTAWKYQSSLRDYETEIEKLEASGEGWALTQLVFLHFDNIGEDSERIYPRREREPSWETRNLLGCDQNGRDVFARIIFGTRISLTIGVVAVSIYVTIGVILGSLAGYFGRWVDMLISRLVEMMMAMPGLFLLLTVIAILETRNIFMIMGALGLIGWPGVTRLVRGEFFRQRSLDYVVAARALGLPERRIIFGHVLQNSIGPVLVVATFGVAGAIMAESTLSFLGLGDTNAPSWGQILDEGRVSKKLHLILSPGVAIFVLVTLFNLVGEGLRDALDPRLRK